MSDNALTPGSPVSAPRQAAPQAPAPPSPAQQDIELAATAAEGLPMVGKVAAQLIRQRRWRLLLVAVWLLFFGFLYPLLLPWWAATLINWGALMGWHKGYAGAVRDAFRVQVAHDRLDFFLFLRFDQPASTAPSFAIPVRERQRMQFRFTLVNVIPEGQREAAKGHDSGCVDSTPPQINGNGTPLYKLTVNGVEIAELSRNTDSRALPVTAEHWNKIQPLMGAEGRVTVAIVPVAVVATLCPRFKGHLEGSIEVFKDQLEK